MGVVDLTIFLPSLRLASMAGRIIVVPVSLLRFGLTYVLDVAVFLALMYAFLHRVGAIKRIIQWRTEAEIGALANGALITVGDMNVDIVTGKVVATDLIIHASKRNEWMWDSPLIARIGRLDVRLNILSCIDVVGPFLGFPCKDIHSVVVEDVQVFVEKRRNVFNFHLLDPSLDLPDADDVLESMGVKRDAQSARGGAKDPDGLPDMEIGTFGGSRMVGHHHLHGGIHAASMAAEAKANEIVTGLVGAVSSVGRAATGAGENGESLITALMNQKAGFVGQLREFQARLEGGGGGGSSTYGSSRRGGGSNLGSISEEGTSEAAGDRRGKISSKHKALAKDGVKVIQKMGEVLNKNVSEMKEQVDSFQPPPKKEGWVDPGADDRFRFGRIVLRDARIFTKDIIGGSKSSTKGSSSDADEQDDEDGMPPAEVVVKATGGKTTAPAAAAANAAAKKASSRQRPPSVSGWAEPIHIRELAVSGAELCPPMMARDEDDGNLPELGLKIERVLDIVVARLLAETAKSNTGRLLNNAFGEFCTWMERKKDSTSAGGGRGRKRGGEARQLQMADLDWDDIPAR